MATNNKSYIPSCFSGVCGHCVSCCGNATQESITSEMDCVHRAKVLAKFPQKSGDNLETYMNEINKIKYRHKEHLPKPDEIIHGVIPDKFKVGGGLFSDPELYTLLKTQHGAICDTPKCKVHYVNSPEFFHMSWFPDVPMYTRERDDGHQLCILCVKKTGKIIQPDI